MYIPIELRKLNVDSYQIINKGGLPYDKISIFLSRSYAVLYQIPLFSCCSVYQVNDYCDSNTIYTYLKTVTHKKLNSTLKS
jgi:hypothetical protein